VPFEPAIFVTVDPHRNRVRVWQVVARNSSNNNEKLGVSVPVKGTVLLRVGPPLLLVVVVECAVTRNIEMLAVRAPFLETAVFMIVDPLKNPRRVWPVVHVAGNIIVNNDMRAA